MSAGLFDPLINYLTAALQASLESGTISAHGELKTQLVEWATNWSTIRQATGGMTLTICAWLVLFLAAAVCLIFLCCLSERRFPRVRRRHVLVVLTATTAISVLIVTVFFARASHRQLAAFAEDDLKSISSSGPRRVLLGLVTSAEELLSSSISQANVSIAGLCSEAGPRLRKLLGSFTSRLASRLSDDARLTPLLAALDNFATTVKRVVAAMSEVAVTRRGGFYDELATFKALADDVRGRTVEALESTCAEFGTCSETQRLTDHLVKLTVEPSVSRLDVATSVTAVTLLDRVFRLNVSELGHRVQMAKSAIATALGSFDGQAALLPARLSARASSVLQRGMDAITNVSKATRTAVEGREAEAAIGSLWNATAIVLTIACASVFIVITLLMSAWFHQVPLRKTRSVNCSRTAVIAVSSCLSIVLMTLFLLGAAINVLGRTVANEACEPLVTVNGHQILGARLDTVLQAAVWPVLRRLTTPPVPLRLGPKPPMRVLESLLSGCGSNRTLAYALRLNLTELVDASILVGSNVITEQLSGVKADLKQKLMGGAAASLIPTAEVSGVLTSLAQFAAVLDPVDYSSSIAELSRPLFRLDSSSLKSLPDRIRELGFQVLTRNFTDQRGFKLVMEADRLRSIVTERSPRLIASMERLRLQFETLQSHRSLGSLTASLAARLQEFRSGVAGLTADGIELRFDESFNATKPEAIDLLNNLLASALSQVGRCDGLPELFARVGESCTSSSASLVTWAAWLQAVAGTACTCLLISISSLLLTRVESRQERLQPPRAEGSPIDASDQLERQCMMNDDGST